MWFFAQPDVLALIFLAVLKQVNRTSETKLACWEGPGAFVWGPYASFTDTHAGFVSCMFCIQLVGTPPVTAYQQ